MATDDTSAPMDISPEALDELLDGEAPIDLTAVTCNGMAPMLYAAYSFDLDAVTKMLAPRVKVNVDAQAANTGYTALMFMAESGDADTVKALAAAAAAAAGGVDGPRTKDRQVWVGVYAPGGQTALHLAAAAAGKLDNCRALLQAGAAVTATDADGNDARFYAYSAGHGPAFDEVVAAVAGAPLPDAPAALLPEAVQAKKRTDQAAIQRRMDEALRDGMAEWAAATAAATASLKDGFLATAPAFDTVVLVPGKGCTAKAVYSTGFYADVGTQLAKLGLQVVVPGLNAPDMPQPMVCRERVWVPHVAALSSTPHTTLFIGHR